MKLALSGVVALLVLCAASGCSTEASDPGAEPTSLPTQAPSAVDPSTPSEPPAWHEKFTAEQIDAYEAALNRWQQYAERTNEAWRVGDNSAEARATIREYDMQWQATLSVFEDSVTQGIRIERPIKPIWSKPTLIRLGSDGTGTVVIYQCTDYRGLLVTQNGRELRGTKPDHRITPFTVHMAKPEDGDWMVARTQLKDAVSCDA
ncbi:hypothetical protein [Nocardioides terrigena]|uniref:hypothetical protein n=1 Tax=Nocardioides terrigena TaxID=424797 RepID=UPI00131F38EE|nr:hypothetical protein [Nocardioides terrigena]